MSATTEQPSTERSLNEKMADAIRSVIRREDLQQNWVGIASGLGPDELSRRMTSKVSFDTADIDHVARALNMDPFDLWHLAIDGTEDGTH